MGFDGPSGLQIYRLVSATPPATDGSTMSSAGWSQQGVSGLTVSYTKIISSTSISDGTNNYVYVAAGTGSDVIKIFRQID